MSQTITIEGVWTHIYMDAVIDGLRRGIDPPHVIAEKAVVIADEAVKVVRSERGKFWERIASASPCNPTDCDTSNRVVKY